MCSCGRLACLSEEDLRGCDISAQCGLLWWMWGQKKNNQQLIDSDINKYEAWSSLVSLVDIKKQLDSHAQRWSGNVFGQAFIIVGQELHAVRDLWSVISLFSVINLHHYSCNSKQFTIWPYVLWNSFRPNTGKCVLEKISLLPVLCLRCSILKPVLHVKLDVGSTHHGVKFKFLKCMVKIISLYFWDNHLFTFIR